MLKQNLTDKLLVVPPPTDLVTIFSRWDQPFHFAWYYQSSNVNYLGAQGTNRLGVSIGDDANGNPVVNNLTPWGYYTAYSQRGVSKWAAKACVLQDLPSLNTALLAHEYAFKFQNYQGKDLIGATTLYDGALTYDGRMPTFATSITQANDLQQFGDMSFFLADVQHTLHIFRASSWFNTSAATAPYRARLQALLPYIYIAISWLGSPTILSAYNMTRWQVLSQNDTVAPNRLSQHGTAYYGLGVYFNDKNLMNLGKYLLQYALKYQINTYNDASRSVAGIITKSGYTTKPYMAWARTDAYNQLGPLGWGFFAEQGGSDSSYNGTNILNLLKIFPVVCTQTNDVSFAKQLWVAIVRSMRWQLSMLLPTGQFSQQDNTRVYSGGETYNGKPKQNDYLECLFDFEFYASLIGDQSVRDACSVMLHYYSVKQIVTTAPFTFYTYGRSELLNGDIQLTTDTIRVAIVQITGSHNAPYTVNLATDQFFSVVPNAVGASALADIAEIMDNVTLDSNNNFFSQPVTFSLVQPMPALVQVGAIVIYKDTGNPATSTLIAYSTAATNLPYGPQGGDIQVVFGTTGLVFTVA